MTEPKSVDQMTRDELRAEAKELQIPGRGSMTAAQLRENVAYFRVETIRKATREMLQANQMALYAQAPYLPVSMQVPVLLRAAPNERTARFRDRVARGELIVKTPAGIGGARAITR